MDGIEELKFEILVPEKIGRTEQYLSINTNTNAVTIGNGILKRMRVADDNPYVRFAKVGSDFYISTKIEGTFGYGLKKASASTMKVSNGKSLIESGLNHKIYSLGEMITQGEDTWYKLCEVK